MYHSFHLFIHLLNTKHVARATKIKTSWSLSLRNTTWEGKIDTDTIDPPPDCTRVLHLSTTGVTYFPTLVPLS